MTNLRKQFNRLKKKSKKSQKNNLSKINLSLFDNPDRRNLIPNPLNDFLRIKKISTRGMVRFDNDTLLNSLSFATAKLSETYTNLKFSFRSDEERKKYLAGQKRYREETIMLRKRCIELNPGKAAYYSYPDRMR